MRFSSGLTLVLAFVVAAGAASAQAVIELSNPERSGGLATPFDTPEARRAVPPMGFPTLTAPSASDASGRSGRAGTPGVSPARPPAPGAEREARRLYPDQWSLLQSPAVTPQGAIVAPAAAPTGIFSQYCENCSNPNPVFPQSTAGKLFFETSEGSSSCSATVIGERLIATAAHCCWDSDAGARYNTFTFAPAYRDGAAPFGTFRWSALRVLRSYRTSPGRSNDLCLITLRNDASGHPVSHYVGWAGTGWNFPYEQNLHALGYPGNIGDSEFLELCTATTSQPPRGCARSNVLNMGCSMTYGASGGGWVQAYRNGHVVTSVVSGYDNETCAGPFGTVFNGPRFVDANFRALCTAGTPWC